MSCETSRAVSNASTSRSFEYRRASAGLPVPAAFAGLHWLAASREALVAIRGSSSRAAAIASATCMRGDVHDSTAARQQLGQRPLASPEGARQIDADDALPDDGRDGVAERPVDVVPVANIDRHERGLAAGRLD